MNTSPVSAATLTSGYWTPVFQSFGDGVWDINFGQKPFKYIPPEGHQPINDANLPSPEFVRPDSVVGVTTYTGNQTARVLSTEFAPDFVWTKRVDDTNSHQLYDSVRGDDKSLSSDSTNAEVTTSNSASFASSNGINIGSATRSNENSVRYVTWAWKAGGSKGTFNKDGIEYASAAAAGLDGGSATPTGSSVGTKQGFSIIAASGSNSAAKTFSHGLSQAPDFAIFKLLADAPSNGYAQNWQVYHQSLGNTKGLQLDLNSAQETTSSLWNNTSPTDTLFSIGASTRYEGAFISYLWHDVPGLQKFGSYAGNNVDDGPFVELGFRPAILWVKSATASTGNWLEASSTSTRNNYNVVGKVLRLNTTGAETDSAYFDFLSNGFKVRANLNGLNSSADTQVIYAAWAYQPMNNLYGGQSNAR